MDSSIPRTMTIIQTNNNNDKTDIVAPAEPVDYLHEKWPDFRQIFSRGVRRICTPRIVLNRFPILQWSRQYQLGFLYQDFIAGISVALTAIPQGIAYAVLAGLPPQYGLYSGFVGCFVYLILGSCKDVTIGPTAILALMIQKYVEQDAGFGILITFLSGIITLLLGLLNLGFLVQFISVPVTAGFATAAALTIGSSQIKPLFGLAGTSSDFLDSWMNFFRQIGNPNWWDTVLGISTIAILLALRQLKDVRRPRPLAVVCKYISLARNALVVIGGTLLAYLLTSNDASGTFTLTGNITAGLPPFQVPPFELQVNRNLVGFSDVLSYLGTTVVSVPLISILELIAISKTFAEGKTIDATQELIAMGTVNVVGSFFGSMPVTGSFSRTAINNASGVRTTFGGVFTGALILLSLAFLTDTFHYLPKATLAAVVITAMIFMVEFNTALQIWRTRRLDFIPFACTLIACLAVGIEYGMIIGIGINLIFILYMTARPKFTATVMEHSTLVTILLIELSQSLVFSAAENLKYEIQKRVQKSGCQVCVIDGRQVHSIDVTVARVLTDCWKDLKMRNDSLELIFWNWPPQPTGVAWRQNRQFAARFMHADTMQDLLEKIK